MLVLKIYCLSILEVNFLKISIIGGTGYVGLTTAACLAFKGHTVYSVGRNIEKINKINNGIATVYEECLSDILRSAISKGLLFATEDHQKALMNSSIIFICVGTPSKEDGSIDLSQIKTASEQIGESLKKKKDYCVIVVKSTVVPGTTEEFVIPLIEEKSKKEAGVDFGVCMNPEFLREGSAVKDFLYPKEQGIVIGELDKRSGDSLFKIYEDFDAKILRTTLRGAEMIKYARNSYLAKDISFANEIANLCRKLGVDYNEVKIGMEMDSRIGRGRFLNAGIGFGGSCFPKDVKALIAKAKSVGVELGVLERTLLVNEIQPLLMINMLKEFFKSIKGHKIAVLGLAFKKGTDDMRESRSIPIIRALQKEEALIYAFDPQATARSKEIFGDEIYYALTAEEALANAEACLIVTDWPQFSNPKLYNHMKGRIIIDGRRILDPENLSSSFVYRAIGFPE